MPSSDKEHATAFPERKGGCFVSELRQPTTCVIARLRRSRGNLKNLFRNPLIEIATSASPPRNDSGGRWSAPWFQLSVSLRGLECAPCYRDSVSLRGPSGPWQSPAPSCRPDLCHCEAPQEPWQSQGVFSQPAASVSLEQLVYIAEKYPVIIRFFYIFIPLYG